MRLAAGEGEGEVVGLAVVGVEVGAGGKGAEDGVVEAGHPVVGEDGGEEGGDELAVGTQDGGGEGGEVVKAVSTEPGFLGRGAVGAESVVEAFAHDEGEALVVFRCGDVGESIEFGECI